MELPTLPEEVMDRLSLVGQVRFTAWKGEEPVVVNAPVAPLHRQLFVLAHKNGAIETALMQDGRAELWVEHKEPPWQIRVIGRAVAGRDAAADPRRSELLHWLPDGTRAQNLLAIRFFPESMDYHVDGTRRASGPIPGAVLPSELTRWSRMVTRGHLGWMPVLGLITWGGILAWVPPELRNLLVLCLMLTLSLTLFSGVALLGRYGEFLRWREGTLREAGVAELLAGWQPPWRVRDLGAGLLAGGLLLVGIVALVMPAPVPLTILVASGVGVYGPVHVVRYLGRHTDAAVEV
jgi:hypothetical protein